MDSDQTEDQKKRAAEYRSASEASAKAAYEMYRIVQRRADHEELVSSVLHWILETMLSIAILALIAMIIHMFYKTMHLGG